MGQTTAIQWCDATLNLMMGCDGCALWQPATVKGARRSCYAGVMTEKATQAGELVKGFPNSFDVPQIFSYRMAEAEKWKDLTGTTRTRKTWLDGMPRVIFTNDMGDTFTRSLPERWIDPFILRMEKTPHLYLLLTKRIKRARAWWNHFDFFWCSR